MKKAFVLLFFIAFFIFKLTAQDIGTDSKNKGIFTYYPTKKYRLEFSSKDFSLSISSNPKDIYYVPDEDDTTIINVKKQSNFYTQGSILNASDFLSLSNLTGFRPGGRIKLGYQRAVDTVYSNYSGYTFSFGGNLFFSVDNVKLYNTNTKAVEKKYPATVGAELNTIIFLPIKWMVASLTGSVSNGWNDNSLRNFKDISSGSIANGNIIAFEKFDGKYGVLQTGLNKARLSLSFPIAFWRLNTIPYTVWTSISGNSPSYFLGIYTNILSEKLDFHSFKLPSTFGFGVDWVRSADKWSSANIFVRGSINLSKY